MKMKTLFDLVIGLVRKEEGSRYEAPIQKPKPMSYVDPDIKMDYDSFHKNIQKQLKKIYNDTKRSN